ncbi:MULTISPECIES: vWA domain-containing protein [Vitreoscilla]|uniref:VWA domain-containing protein n=1 Tax=Vitreoscilla stercoraria TaxID=61 RepID=A0ABY4E6S8_VITST|nr:MULTISPECIES: VWA domain-containing protein [Vitreoscilla]AUZ04857.1 von Willebrand factor [Vitreoscilla sp. C1]UOO91481.1 VWA domain-containing protein [Vitreoscilla stercoraria]
MHIKISSFLVVSALLSGCGGNPAHQLSTSAQSETMARNLAPQAIHAAAAPYMPEVATASVQDTERYGELVDNPVKEVSREPISTFSADVDTGSYANVRRFLNQGQLPPKDAVRMEELINYFPLDAKLTAHKPHPFALETEVVDSPWLQDAKVLRIVMQAQEQKKEAMPPANLVFLVDVSGSMDDNNKLPLVKQTLRLLTEQLRPQDKVTLVAYASGTQVHISGANGRDKNDLLKAIDQLRASGSTAGADAMEVAYKQAQKHHIKDGINRILMMTDGDFNVGTVDFNTLKSRVEQQRKSGVSLTTLGFGTGNYNEHLMEQMADAGDGNYAYIDNEKEAKKVLQQQLTSTLSTVASDVKIQVEFNPATVSQYRLIGYENRLLKQEDFNNDNKDAGDIGAGHTVTALYEFVPQGVKGWLNTSRYQNPAPSQGDKAEYAHVNVRYKPVGKSTSVLLSRPVLVSSKALAQASNDTRFTIAVATYGQLLRGGDMVGKRTWSDASTWAKEAKGKDEFGLRQELVELIGRAQNLSANQAN